MCVCVLFSYGMTACIEWLAALSVLFSSKAIIHHEPGLGPPGFFEFLFRDSLIPGQIFTTKTPTFSIRGVVYSLTAGILHVRALLLNTADVLTQKWRSYQMLIAPWRGK